MPNEVILVVEDNDLLREGLRILLETEGFRAFSASHGREALGVMETTCPDLILSDISMPEMDGFEFYRVVRTRPEWVTIPFIFLTARGERDDIFAGKKLGVEDYLVKPVDRQELLTTIRSRLERTHQLLLAQLEQAYETSLIMLANAIELRDQYTRGHVERVMNIALIIARHLGLSETSLKPLRFGAILHDIGKIYIRETVLSKTGPLNSEEWNEMKKHTIYGSELIEHISYLTPAIPLIRNHHERWDGRGYPDGLKGEQIPLGARIIAVADSFDAMTAERVYQKAISPQQALREIEASRGTKYDPAIVDALKAAWGEIEAFLSKETRPG